MGLRDRPDAFTAQGSLGPPRLRLGLLCWTPGSLQDETDNAPDNLPAFPSTSRPSGQPSGAPSVSASGPSCPAQLQCGPLRQAAVCRRETDAVTSPDEAPKRSD